MIYSLAAIEATTIGAVPPLVCVELYDGKPLSYMTTEAARLLELVRRHAVLVPTTTRTLAQFDRVTLWGGSTPYAITSNGGHIVVNGVPDEQWRRSVEERIAGEGAALSDIVAGLDMLAAGDWVLNRKTADDLFCYLVVDLARLPGDFLARWTSWCADRGWVVSMQGRKIYALPRGLTKEAALGEIMTRTGADRLLAAGDGALDAGFLTMADAAIRPPHGELAETGWRVPQLRIAEAVGVLAGEEMTGWLAAQLGMEDGGNLRQLADVSADPIGRGSSHNKGGRGQQSPAFTVWDCAPPSSGPT